ncbi:MAG: EamA family transporter [Clostridia bacterium]|nr:EamA family transporter [Clostridia bacterium]
MSYYGNYKSVRKFVKMGFKRRLKGFAPIFVIMAGACWGVIGVFSKQLTGLGFSPIQTVFLRFGLATVLLWLYFLVFDRAKLKIRLRDIWMFFGTGILSLALFSTLYFTTIRNTTLSLAAVLLYTAPCFVMLMSAIFFREKIGLRKISALLLAFSGCVFTTGLFEALIGGKPLGFISLTGILTGIGSGFGYALYSIFGTVALKKYDTVTVTAYTFLTVTLALSPFCLGKEFFALFRDGTAVPSAAGITLISTLLPYLLYTKGLKHTAPGNASVLAFSEPLVATLAGLVFFRERLTLGGAVGMLLIFASIIILGNNKTAELENATPEN